MVEEAEGVVSQLALNGIIWDEDEPYAIINGEVVNKGDMIKSIQFDSYDYKFIIGSIQLDPPYPEWLEDPKENAPNAPYEARPWLEPASDRQEPIIIRNLGKVIPDLTDDIFRRR